MDVQLSTFRREPTGGQTWTSATWPSTMDPNDTADADITLWTFDEATGLLRQKRYADNVGPDYTYTADGKLYERKWARIVSGSTRLTTTSGYSTGSTGTGELISVDYNDGSTADPTPSVDYTYNRSGDLASVVDAVGTRNMTYHARSEEHTSELQSQ